MRYEPKFDDPSRTADYGYFPRERIKPPKITGDDLADAILNEREPTGAPFREWVPIVFQGQFDTADTITTLKAMLDSEGAHSIATDILNDIAHDNYGDQK